MTPLPTTPKRPRDRHSFRSRPNYAMTQTVFEFICRYVRENTYPPTLEEIARGCFIARSTVVRHIDRLEGEGRIARNPYISRGITILDACPGADETEPAADAIRPGLRQPDA
ncbi:MAG: hypothetical protein NZM00_11475 [Anaerolinea sp.]|nr:hypothetical protein [Anaerolinea sp.]